MSFKVATLRAVVHAGHKTSRDDRSWFYELARLVSHLVTPKNKKIERYMYGLAPQIHKMVAATEPTMIQSVVLKAGVLTDEAIRNGSIKKNPEKRENGESQVEIGIGSFDVIIGMYWLSYHKVEIICHEKVVRIPLPNGKVLRVIGERPDEKVRHLVSNKVKEQKQEDCGGYRLS
uniref:Reverse transcriptase domain-containing protein n=1 Tax=Tanacetum cinerariifolium TaxID=118510 RepID=A0A699K125_TANCI|nr:reverse transcriptase domain-containing protein [Tanacetum cinerariifolium]